MPPALLLEAARRARAAREWRARRAVDAKHKTQDDKSSRALATSRSHSQRRTTHYTTRQGAQPLQEVACVRMARYPREGCIYAAEVAAPPDFEPGARALSLLLAALLASRISARVPAELLGRQELTNQACRHPKGEDRGAPLQRAGAGGAHVLYAAASRCCDVAEGAP
eukprot:scaffold18152_cov88-Phaeocystis_antarctica.AAC.4